MTIPFKWVNIPWIFKISREKISYSEEWWCMYNDIYDTYIIIPHYRHILIYAFGVSQEIFFSIEFQDPWLHLSFQFFIWRKNLDYFSVMAAPVCRHFMIQPFLCMISVASPKSLKLEAPKSRQLGSTCALWGMTLVELCARISYIFPYDSSIGRQDILFFIPPSQFRPSVCLSQYFLQYWSVEFCY